ncbi:MAG: DUF2155 domain-containing protein [Alphaproteobacteria bacterium]|nr:DUF2155 domain-containing protein [Alphaproteobacteria bacterium]
MNKFSKTILTTSLALTLAPNSFAENIEMNTANLQAMDKITGRVSELNVPVNGLANFGTFSILVRKCITKSPEETPENTAFIDVVDNYKSENPVNIFKGWMFSSTPGINGVEHPIYDIWLLKCYNSDSSKHKILTEEQLKFRDELPMVRQEKIEQKIKLSAVDSENSQPLPEHVEATNNESDTEAPVSSEDTITINVNENLEVSQANEDKPSEEAVIDDDFIAEGEEIVGETIVVDNETVAQDEENQKTQEEIIEEAVEDTVADEI